jgi:DNA-binding response OmpR family regulator
MDACDMLRLALEQADTRWSSPRMDRRLSASPLNFAPDVAILHVGLPGTSGYEPARRVRPRYPRLRLIARTRYGQGERG